MTLLLAIFLAFITSASLSSSPEPKAELYRLPIWYSPSSYNIQLNLPPAVFTSTSNAFTGSVSIIFSVTSVTASISLHSQHDFVTITAITVGGTGVDAITGNTTVALTNIPVTDYSTNNVTDILTITLASDLIPDVVYALVIDYSSRLSTSDMYGLYKSSYVDGTGVTKYLVTTQFAATFARRAFPCFDEPALKATFDLTVIVPTGLEVLSNTREIQRSINAISGLTTVTFNTTAKMSSYLLALVVSDFTCTSGELIGTVPYQVCSRNQSISTRDLAVEYGPKLLGSLNNFTNYDYSRGIEKLDQVAIPDFAAGAMENWGLVTYRETALLWDPNESSNRYKQRVVTVVAHELSHQWFGNLVTCSWWSEIFLNEGFATYFEYHIAHEVVPSWELNKQFVLEQVHTALLSDALQNAQSLQTGSSTPAEIIARFNVISYNKGGSILRMVQHFMQFENFRAGLQNYLLTYEYNNTVPDDLWKILNSSVPSVSKLPSDLLTVMYNWVTLPGYPLLTVNLRGNTVTISQRRFLLSGSDARNEWYVPISYTTSATPNKFESTTPDVWLAPAEDVSVTIPQEASWIILNNQQTGYYRVNYDNTLWARIRAGLLSEDFDGINELNRAQIVDDLFNLARADHLSYPFIFDVMRFLYNDVSYYTWYPAFSGYNFLLRRVGEDSELGVLIRVKILELMSTLYRSLPLTTLKENDQIYTLNQVQAHSWACRLGGSNCITEIQKQFSEYKETGVRPNKNFRGIVYCYALRYSNDSTDWNFLWDAYVNSTDLATEQITILASLGCTTDVPLLTGYLQRSITNGSGIRPQDALSVFTSVYTSSTIGANVAFDFLIQNHVAIAEKYQSMNSLSNLIKGIAERFTTQDQVDRLKAFINTGNLSEDFKSSAQEALETAEANLRWRAKYEDSLFAYYSSGVKVGYSLLAMSLAMICVFLAK